MKVHWTNRTKSFVEWTACNLNAKTVVAVHSFADVPIKSRCRLCQRVYERRQRMRAETCECCGRDLLESERCDYCSYDNHRKKMGGWRQKKIKRAIELQRLQSQEAKKE